jgi:hypothetical protein
MDYFSLEQQANIASFKVACQHMTRAKLEEIAVSSYTSAIAAKTMLEGQMLDQLSGQIANINHRAREPD